MDVLHHALDERRVVHFKYWDKQDAASERRIWPLGLVYWGGQWTLSVWCELRGDFRNFDVARIQEVSVDEVPPDLDGHRLTDSCASPIASAGRSWAARPGERRPGRMKRHRPYSAAFTMSSTTFLASPNTITVLSM